AAECSNASRDQHAQLPNQRWPRLEQLCGVEPPSQLVAYLAPDLPFGGKVRTGHERGVREGAPHAATIRGVVHGRLPSHATGHSMRGQLEPARPVAVPVRAASTLVASSIDRARSIRARAADPRPLRPKATSGRWAACAACAPSGSSRMTATTD